MKTLIVAGGLLLCGCAASPPESEDLARMRAAVSFRAEESPDMTGFTKHWSVGSQSAWYNMSAGEVLVVGPAKAGSLRIAGFPKDLGMVVATGWGNGEKFFVHVSPGPDRGTLIYIDLEKKEVTEVKHWGAW